MFFSFQFSNSVNGERWTDLISLKVNASKPGVYSKEIIKWGPKVTIIQVAGKK